MARDMGGAQAVYVLTIGKSGRVCTLALVLPLLLVRTECFG